MPAGSAQVPIKLVGASGLAIATLAALALHCRLRAVSLELRVRPIAGLQSEARGMQNSSSQAHTALLCSATYYCSVERPRAYQTAKLAAHQSAALKYTQEFLVKISLCRRHWIWLNSIGERFLRCRNNRWPTSLTCSADPIGLQAVNLATTAKPKLALRQLWRTEDWSTKTSADWLCIGPASQLCTCGFKLRPCDEF